MAGAWFEFEYLQVVENVEVNEGIRLERRQIRDTSNAFEMPDVLFKKNFRLTKDLVRQLIVHVQPFMAAAQRTSSIPIHLKVLSALNFYATGSYQTAVGNSLHLGLSQPSMSKALGEVTDALVEISGQFIKFPTTHEEVENTKTGFYNLFGFPNILGCIDGTHISIICPNEEEYPALPYFNRKGYYSLNVQIICDVNLKIININARYPGGTHDSAIWRMSNVCGHLENNYFDGERNTWLLGDSGYPLQPFLLTPVLNAAPESPEYHYNILHRRVRNTIERLNGTLKGRFRCLHKHRTLHYAPPKAAKIIYACGVLHNMCRMHNVQLDENEEVEEENIAVDILNEQDIPVNLLGDGRRIRQEFINNHF